MKVVVLGGGVIGLTTAYYLSKNGFNVSIYDKSSILDSTSCKNAGYTYPSMYIPITLSLSMKNTFKWIFKRKYEVGLKLTLKKLRWLYKVYRYRDRVRSGDKQIIIATGHCRFGLTFSIYTAKEVYKMIIDNEYNPQHCSIEIIA